MRFPDRPSAVHSSYSYFVTNLAKVLLLVHSIKMMNYRCGLVHCSSLSVSPNWSVGLIIWSFHCASIVVAVIFFSIHRCSLRSTRRLWCADWISSTDRSWSRSSCVPVSWWNCPLHNGIRPSLVSSEAVSTSSIWWWRGCLVAITISSYATRAHLTVSTIVAFSPNNFQRNEKTVSAFLNL